MEKNKEKKNRGKESKMKEITIGSIILHCSASDQAKLDRSIKLLKLISKANPVKTLAKKRIPAFKIRPGLPIGCKVTIRKNTKELLKTLLTGNPEINKKQFSQGFLSFGIKEYIEIPSIPYQRDIGIMGFDVVVKLKRPGFRVSKKKRNWSKIGNAHKITKSETIKFFEENFGIKV